VTLVPRKLPLVLAASTAAACVGGVGLAAIGARDGSSSVVLSAATPQSRCPTALDLVRPSPGISSAADEIQHRYEGRSAGSGFLEVYVCRPYNTLIVYRVPGDETLDAELAEITNRHEVALQLADAKYSAQDLKATAYEIGAQLGKLIDQGIRISAVGRGFEEGGYVQVYVVDKPEAARKALAAFGDKVRVVEGGEAIPLVG
jgi:hypothetical protein